MATIDSLPFDRVTYREGQRLTARDLKDDRARRTSLRRLHVRHLHETWGIATGFDVQAAGASAVGVGPGYAIDIVGRDLVLSSSLAIPVPAAAGPTVFVLVATFLEDCAFPTTAAGAGVCLDAPIHPRRERPAFAWRTAAEFEPGPMVPLGHVLVEKGAIKGAVNLRVRRYARRLVRPLIATGITDPSDTWTIPWHSGGFVEAEQRVSTVDAGFHNAPIYFAWPVVVRPTPGDSSAAIARAIAQSYPQVTERTANGFVFRMVLDGTLVGALREAWAVSWLGVEQPGGCGPSLDLKKLLTAAGLFFKFA
jgi:hypothetical protein